MSTTFQLTNATRRQLAADLASCADRIYHADEKAKHLLQLLSDCLWQEDEAKFDSFLHAVYPIVKSHL